MAVYDEIKRPASLVLIRRLHFFHPITALAYLSVAFVIAFLFAHPVFAASYTLLAFLQAGYFAGFGIVFQKLKSYAPFAFLMVVINPFFNHRGFHILFYLFDKPITLEAFCYGLYMMLLLVSILFVFITINQILTARKFLYLFSGVAPQMAFIVGMTLRFIGVLQMKAQDFLGVQKSRDVNAPVRPFSRRLQRAGKLLGAFCVWAIEDGMQASETLRAKEYGKHKRSHYKTYAFTAKDGICTGLFLLFGVGVFLLRAGGAGEYDYFRKLMEPDFHPLMWTALVSVLFYMTLPVIMDCILFMRGNFFRWREKS